MSGDGPAKVEFYRHSVGEEERRAVSAALGGVFLTTGAEVRAFEEELAAYLGGGGAALGVSSCTAALHLALASLGIECGDEVITTPMTFIATATPILFLGATPVFADVDPATGLLDPTRVEAAITPRTKAVIVVHLYGQMVDMGVYRELCDRHGLMLIEDAAHTVEGRRDGVAPGELGDAACFSFYATKNITCGEGGALVMRDADRLARARRLSLHGMSAGAADRYAGGYRHWDMLELGYKYNMTNIQAAMLRPQLARIEGPLARREELALRYEEAFADLEGLDYPRVEPGGRSARHLFTIWAPAESRDAYLTELGERGIGVAVNYRAIHLLTYFRERFGFGRGDFPAAEAIGDRTISLPLYPKLTDDEQRRTIDVVRQLYREHTVAAG